MDNIFKKNHVSLLNNIMKKNWFVFSLRTLCFIIAGMLIFKNTLFYSTDELKSFPIQDSIMVAYENNESYYSPLDDTANIVLCDLDLDTNGITIELDSGLEEDTLFTLINSSSDIEQYTICSRTVNSGNQSVKLKFDNVHFSEMKILATSADGTHIVNIPLGTISIDNTYLNIIQKSTNYLYTIIFVILISLMFSLFIWKLDVKYKKNSIEHISVARERNSNIELLRIICMFAIILHHYVVHGGATSMDYCSNKLVAYIFLPAGKICFNAFIAISMWFLVDQKFRISRFLKMWLQVFFYSVSLTIVAMFVTDSFSIKNLFSSMLPIAGNSHGFAAAYLLFYLLMPYLQMVMDKLNKRKSSTLLLLLFYAQLGSQIIGIINNYTQNFASEIGLFIFCFVLSYYLKKWPPVFVHNKLFNLVLFGLISLLLYVANCMTYLWENGTNISRWILNLSNGESSILMIIAGYSLFFIFKNLKIKNNKFINKIASYTFGILLIHDHNYLRTVFWYNIISPERWYYSYVYVLRLVIMGISIFYICCVIDYIRKTVFERMIVESNSFKTLCKTLEKTYN